jgi:hypothetical protein
MWVSIIFRLSTQIPSCKGDSGYHGRVGCRSRDFTLSDNCENSCCTKKHIQQINGRFHTQVKSL